MSDKILIDEFGFREYDARWLFPDSINELGIEAVGKGVGTQVINKVKNPTLIVHNKNSFSKNILKDDLKKLIKLSNLQPIDIFYIYSNPEFDELFSNFDLLYKHTGWHVNHNINLYQISSRK